MPTNLLNIIENPIFIYVLLNMIITAMSIFYRIKYFDIRIDSYKEETEKNKIAMIVLLSLNYLLSIFGVLIFIIGTALSVFTRFRLYEILESKILYPIMVVCTMTICISGIFIFPVPALVAALNVSSFKHINIRDIEFTIISDAVYKIIFEWKHEEE